MVDTYVAEVLFGCIADDVTVVIVGDPEQLPSVGPGAVLRDIIDSNICPVTFLERIHRQNMESQIYQNSHKIRRGETDLVDGIDFKFHDIKGLESCKELMTELYLKRIEEYGIENTMLLLPYKKYTAGVEDMNKHLQSLVNPESLTKKQLVSGMTTYRVGDPVMHITCNKDNVSNGDTGIVQDIVKDDNGYATAVVVRINGKRIEYERADLDTLTLAYACTVHKSQGSEASAVITCLTDEHTAMLYRNIPYVAISRGKKMVDLIGNKAAIDTAIKSYRSNTRVTLLSYLLNYAAGKFVAV
jgi:exodeoxyribonuclease V alpha subunit